jgi:hypothetical protein
MGAHLAFVTGRDRAALVACVEYGIPIDFNRPLRRYPSEFAHRGWTISYSPIEGGPLRGTGLDWLAADPGDEDSAIRGFSPESAIAQVDAHLAYLEYEREQYEREIMLAGDDD